MTIRFSRNATCAMRAALASLALAALGGCGASTNAATTEIERPALTVTATTPHATTWPQSLAASGNVAPWQEAIIGSEIAGLRLSEVLVNVGDIVKKGQVLARMQDETVRNDLAQQEAALKEAQATLAQAKLNIERARSLEPSGSISRQDILNYETQAATSAARVASAQAMLAAQHLRLGYTQVLSPDDGAISSRTATVGAVTGMGTELFRLIRRNRLEWRAEMSAEDMARVGRGGAVLVNRPGGGEIHGKVRQLGPTVDAATRRGLVYVDLPPDSGLRAGMFVTGSMLLPSTPALAIAQGAVLDHDGFFYAFRIGPDSRVKKVKVTVGRRQGEDVEVTSGLKAGDRVVASGGSFLGDGDLVRVVDAAPKTAAIGMAR